MGTEIPVDDGLVDELMLFWQGIFGYSPDVTRGVILGEERHDNRNVLYLTRRGEQLAGTCMTTTSVRVPMLGGFGEVATDPQFRRQGIASDLCGQAVDEFRAGGGEALFLGTGNPEAARVYHRLGWRKLAGANVMANITSADSPEEFLVQHFGDSGPASVREATPEVRVPMIALIEAPHDWQVLDANARMYSTRYCVQNSCMGLYPKYEAVTKDGRGAWFAAYTADRRVVGMSTARLDDSGLCRVDGFAHKRYMDCWKALLQTALEWGNGNGASGSWAEVSVEDEEKRSLFESTGFREAGPGEGFELDGRRVHSARMGKA